jgi:two-component system sensor histidine kinase ChiS
VAGLLAVLAAGPALAAPDGVCAAMRRQASPAIDAVRCAEGFALSPGPPRQRLEQLFQVASDAADTGRPERAAQALDCAEATLATAAELPDWPMRYELVRRRGLLAYRQERIDQALTGFECALRLAEAQEDRAAIARDLKNVGSALRRLGDYPGALRAQARSLEMLRADGGPIGAVLNNLADLYRELGERSEAARYYHEALDALRAEGRPAEAAHVLEALSVLALDSGDVGLGESRLIEALAAYREIGNLPYQLRVRAGLARAALLRGDVPAAAEQVAAGLALAEANRLAVPAALQLQAARVERLQGRGDAARIRLEAALLDLPEGDADRAPLLEELAAAHRALGDAAAAFAALRRAAEAERALDKARYDRQLGWLRSRFETAERDRTIAALALDNQRREAALRQRTLLLWALAGFALTGLLVLWLLLQRRQHRHRLATAAQQARHAQALDRYRREAEALAADRSLLQTLLDSRADAVCLLDTEGLVLAASQAACRLLSDEATSLVGRRLSEALAPEDAASLSAALEQMDDTGMDHSEAMRMPLHGGATLLDARLQQWQDGDGLVLLTLRNAASPAIDASGAGAVAADPVPVPGVPRSARADFREALVALMQGALQAWEAATGLNRVELAERSRLWRVHIDDGRLRTRALERYLSLSRLPQNPRWRDVLRTAYFVLGECKLDAAARDDLQRQVDCVLAHTRRSPTG